MKTYLGFKTVVCTALLAVAWLGAAPTSADARANNGKVHDALLQNANAEKSRELYCGVNGECHVDSRVNTRVSVYINGVFRGTMEPFGDIYPFVADFPNEVTYLRAVGADGRVWSTTVRGSYSSFHWILQ